MCSLKPKDLFIWNTSIYFVITVLFFHQGTFASMLKNCSTYWHCRGTKDAILRKGHMYTLIPLRNNFSFEIPSMWGSLKLLRWIDSEQLHIQQNFVAIFFMQHTWLFFCSLITSAINLSYFIRQIEKYQGKLDNDKWITRGRGLCHALCSHMLVSLMHVWAEMASVLSMLPIG